MTPSTKPTADFIPILSSQGSFRVDQVQTPATPAGGDAAGLLIAA
jgi:hypothetical protein